MPLAASPGYEPGTPAVALKIAGAIPSGGPPGPGEVMVEEREDIPIKAIGIQEEKFPIKVEVPHLM